MITQERVKELFRYDNGVLYWRKKGRGRKACLTAGARSGCGAVHIEIKIDGVKKIYKRYSLVFLYHFGRMPKMLDHINRKRDDDRIENLRECEHWQNSSNKTYSKKSPLPKGVREIKCKKPRFGRYHVKISHRGRYFNLGYYNTIREAALAYNKKAIELCGEFACLNVLAE